MRHRLLTAFTVSAFIFMNSAYSCAVKAHGNSGFKTPAGKDIAEQNHFSDEQIVEKLSQWVTSHIKPDQTITFYNWISDYQDYLLASELTKRLQQKSQDANNQLKKNVDETNKLAAELKNNGLRHLTVPYNLSATTKLRSLMFDRFQAELFELTKRDFNRAQYLLDKLQKKLTSAIANEQQQKAQASAEEVDQLFDLFSGKKPNPMSPPPPGGPTPN